jgi:DNA-directed RNA polymerase specialized sigma24 family protein
MAKLQSAGEHGLPSLSLVFGYIAVKELRLLEDRVRVLARLGYGNAEIATICDTSPAAVRTLKSSGRRKPKKRAQRRGK